MVFMVTVAVGVAGRALAFPACGLQADATNAKQSKLAKKLSVFFVLMTVQAAALGGVGPLGKTPPKWRYQRICSTAARRTSPTMQIRSNRWLTCCLLAIAPAGHHVTTSCHGQLRPPPGGQGGKLSGG